MTTLGRGSTDRESVRALQVTLNVRGLACLRADGVFGPSTEAAVREAQYLTGRPTNGRVTIDDLTAFRRYTPPRIDSGR